MEGYKPQDFSFFHRSEKLVQQSVFGVRLFVENRICQELSAAFGKKGHGFESLQIFRMEPDDVAEEQHRSEYGIRGRKGAGQHERAYIVVCHGGKG